VLRPHWSEELATEALYRSQVSTGLPVMILPRNHANWVEPARLTCIDGANSCATIWFVLDRFAFCFFCLSLCFLQVWSLAWSPDGSRLATGGLQT